MRCIAALTRQVSGRQSRRASHGCGHQHRGNSANPVNPVDPVRAVHHFQPRRLRCGRCRPARTGGWSADSLSHSPDSVSIDGR